MFTAVKLMSGQGKAQEGEKILDKANRITANEVNGNITKFLILL